MTSSDSPSPTFRTQQDHYDGLWLEPIRELPEYVAHDPRRSLMGPLAGRRVLDLGTGTGEWAIFLAQQGAHVVAFDSSFQGVRRAVEGARLQGAAATLRGAAGDAHRLPFADGAFDIIHGQFILHHLELSSAGPELARVLRPDGCAVFLENSAENPLLMLARSHLVGRFGIEKWSVEGEHPFRRDEFEYLRGLFGQGSRHFFEFHCFTLLDEKLLRGRHVFGRLDALVFRFAPSLRRFGYTQWLRFSC